MKKKSVFFVFYSFAVLFATQVAASPYYVSDLGIAGRTSSARSINNLGEVVGFSLTPDQTSYYGYLYKNGVVSVVGKKANTNLPIAINDSGQIVGLSNFSDDGSPSVYGNSYSAAEFFDMDTSFIGSLGSGYSHATAINNLGEVVGMAFRDDDPYGSHAVSFKNGMASELGALYGDIWSSAQGLNDLGQAVGWSVGFGQQSAVLFNNGEVTSLGTLGGSSSIALSINNHGQAVGWSTGDFDSPARAVLYDDGSVINLGLLSGYWASFAFDINETGQAVGVSFIQSGGEVPFYGRATLFSNGNVFDLNDLIDVNSGWDLQQAYGINDLGWIVGDGFINGEQHGFLLSTIPQLAPIFNVPEDIYTVSEPSQFALLMLGGIILVFLRFFTNGGLRVHARESFTY